MHECGGSALAARLSRAQTEAHQYRAWHRLHAVGRHRLERQRSQRDFGQPNQRAAALDDHVALRSQDLRLWHRTEADGYVDHVRKHTVGAFDDQSEALVLFRRTNGAHGSELACRSGRIARNVHRSDFRSPRLHAFGEGLQKFLLVYAACSKAGLRVTCAKDYWYLKATIGSTRIAR